MIEVFKKNYFCTLYKNRGQKRRKTRADLRNLYDPWKCLPKKPSELGFLTLYAFNRKKMLTPPFIKFRNSSSDGSALVTEFGFSVILESSFCLSWNQKQLSFFPNCFEKPPKIAQPWERFQKPKNLDWLNNPSLNPRVFWTVRLIEM